MWTPGVRKNCWLGRWEVLKDGCGFWEQNSAQPPTPCGKQPGRHCCFGSHLDPYQALPGPQGRPGTSRLFYQMGSTCFIHSFIHSTNVYWIPFCARSCNKNCDYNSDKHHKRVPEGPIIGIYKICNQLYKGLSSG